MTALLDAGDAAYPTKDMPTGADVILGYIGLLGATPHIWTRDQVDAVRASGRTWWPIVVPHQGVLSAAVGAACAAAAIAALPGYAHPKEQPVFLDIESGSWLASKVGAMACINAFKAKMHDAGYLQPFAYVPGSAGFDWVASWTGHRPASLPDGVVGQQYASNTQIGDGWDHSVFLASLLDPPPAPTPPPTSQEIFDMSKYVIVYCRDNSGAYFEANLLSGTYWHIPSPSDISARQNALDAAGIKYAPGHVDVTDMSAYGVQVGK